VTYTEVSQAVMSGLQKFRDDYRQQAIVVVEDAHTQ